MWKLYKMVQVSLCAKRKQRHRCRDKRMDTTGGRDGGMNWEIGIDIYALLTLLLGRVSKSSAESGGKLSPLTWDSSD